METKALVLSGGSIKGAFQAGAVKAVIEKGFYPKILYGISVGSLNSTFINHEAGKQDLPYEQLDWINIKDNLIKFWKENVKQPSDLVNKRGYLKLIIDVLFGKFNGLTDTAPLRKMVNRVISLETLRQSKLIHRVGAVNISNGNIVYADPNVEENFIDYIIASTAIPIVMPASLIGGQADKPFFDGGLRDVAPLKVAIQNGADSIVAILCQPPQLENEPFNYQNLPKLAERMTDIMVNEIVNNDIDLLNKVNRFLPVDGSRAVAGPYAGKRKIKLCVIRPSKNINVDITKFTEDDITKMIELGYQTAQEALENADI